MNLKQFQYLLSVAKNMVNNKAGQQEIQDFFVKNGINATTTMTKDFIMNSSKLKEINLEIII